MRRSSFRRDRRPSRLSVQQLEPRLALTFVPTIVTDINATPRSSLPFTPTAVGDVAYFAAADAEHGQELWKTDGTTAGTVLVKDIFAGTGSSEPFGLFAFEDRLFFVADDGEHGFELWVSDGTEDGTQLVADLDTGFDDGPSGQIPAGSRPRDFTVYQNELYFVTDVVNDELGTSQLWKTDGTPEGTSLVVNTTGSRTIGQPFVLGGSLFYFSPSFSEEDTELQRVGDQDPVASFPGTASRDVTVLGDRAYFANNDPASGLEPFVTDGTSAGTFMLVDAAPGGSGDEFIPIPFDSNPAAFTAFGDAVYFTTIFFAPDLPPEATLWKTDGTAEATAVVRGGFRSAINQLAVIDGRLVFAADDGVTGSELWQSDGTEGGTSLLGDLAPGDVAVPDSGPIPRSGSPNSFTELDGELYFFANNSELWKTDGTTEGTVLVSALGADNGDEGSDGGSGSFGMMAVLGSELLFVGSDSETGGELWHSDGTAEGTGLLRDIAPGTNDAFDPFGLPAAAAVLDGSIYFAADDGIHGLGLWKSDGTAEGTSLVWAGLTNGLIRTKPSAPFTFDGAVYFAAFDIDNGRELWKTDGTPDGTVLVANLADDSNFFGSSQPRGFTAVGGFLYFIADSDGVPGIWKIDGTEQGTEFVATFNGTFSEDRLVAVGDKIFFAGKQFDSAIGTELWYLDTTTGDFSPIDLVAGEADSNPTALAAHDGLLYFVADLEGTSGLWVIPGDVPDEFPLTNLFEGQVGTITVLNDTIYFSGLAANDEEGLGPRLYTTDGTAEGTTIADLPGLETFPDVPLLAAIGSQVFFVNQDAEHGRELWTVTNVNDAPTDIALSAASVAENQQPGTAVGTFSSTDPDAGDTFTYALVTGTGDTDNASFTIDGDALKTAASFNFEAKSSYAVRVKSTDQGGLTTEKQFTITVADVNEAPTDIALSATSVAENQQPGTAVGTFSSTDPDAGNTFTYALVTGTGDTDNASFTIDGNTLKTAASFNFEAKSSYAVRVKSTDQGGLTTEKQFTVTVADVNEAPTDIALSATSVAENSAVGTAVGTLTTSDVDAGDTFTYTLVAGEGSADNAAFSLDGNVIKTAASFNFEARTSYSIRVKSTDAGGISTEKQFTITVTDVVEPLAIDRVEPPSSGLYRAGEVLAFTVVLTRPVTVVGKPEIDLTVGRGRAKAVYQSGSDTNQLVFAATVKAGDNDADGVVLGNVIKLPRGASIRLDDTNLPLALPTVNTSDILIDTAPPKVIAVTGPANGSYRTGQPLRFTATLSEAVQVAGVPTLPLTIGTAARPAAYVPAASTPTSLVFEYTVQPGETDSNGIAAGRAIVIPSDASIVDLAGNPAMTAIRAPNLARVLVDSAGPVATSIKAPAAKTYGPNSPIDLVVNFNEPVAFTGAPTLPVQIGTASRSAAFVGYAARSGNKSLVFRITPQAGDIDTDGISVTGPLDLSDADITDVAGNTAAGTLPGVNLSRVLVDGIGPTIRSVGEATLNPAARAVIVRIQFNEPVLVRGTPTIPFTLGGSPRQLTYAGGSNSSSLTFRYAVRKTDNFDLEVVPGKAIVLAGVSAITDRLGNPLDSLTLPSDIIF